MKTLPALLLLALVSLVLSLSHGLAGTATSMDSLTYLQVARSLAEGRGIVAPDFDLLGANFSPVTLWPPLYPALLSLLCLRSDCTAAVILHKSTYLNFALMFLSSAFFYLLCKRLAGTWLALAVTLGLLFMPASQITFLFLWSETLFIPLILLSYYCLCRFLGDAKSTGMLLASLALLALATYTRYVGIGFAFGWLACLYLFSGEKQGTRLRTVMLSGGAYALLLSPLFIRNLLYAGHLSGGERGMPSYRLQEDLVNLLQLITRELFAAQALLLAAWGVLACALLVLAHFRRDEQQPADTRSSTGESLMPWLWCAGYLGFLLVSRNVQKVDLDTRMMSVALPFLVLGAVGLAQLLSRRLAIALAALPAVFILLIAAYSGLATHQTLLKNLRQEHSPGYVNHMRHQSISEPRFDMFRELAQGVELADGDLILTDIPRPQIVRHFFERATVKSIPHRKGKVDFDQLAPFEQRRGLAIIYQPALQQAFIAQYALKDPQAYAMRMLAQDAPILVVELPLR